MKLSKYIATAFAGISLLSGGSVAAWSGEIADSCVETAESRGAFCGLIPEYPEWHSAELVGKLSIMRMPVKISLKAYMVRDSLVQLSLRVPLAGEMGRLVITPEEFVAVDRVHHTYCRESMSKLTSVYPGVIGEFQSLLLARPVLFGRGVLDSGNVAGMIMETDPDGGLIIANTEEHPDLKYGYQIMNNGRIRTMMMSLADGTSIEALYSFPDRGECIKGELMRNGKTYTGSLDFQTVRWGGSEMPMPKLNEYKQLGVKEFVEQFKK